MGKHQFLKDRLKSWSSEVNEFSRVRFQARLSFLNWEFKSSLFQNFIFPSLKLHDKCKTHLFLLEQNWDYRFLENRNLLSRNVANGCGIKLTEVSLLSVALVWHKIQKSCATWWTTHSTRGGYIELKVMAWNLGWRKLLLRKRMRDK